MFERLLERLAQALESRSIAYMVNLPLFCPRPPAACA